VRSHEREVGIVAGVQVEVRAAGHIIRYSREGERLRRCEFGGRFWGCGTKGWIPAFAGMTGWGRDVSVVRPRGAKEGTGLRIGAGRMAHLPSLPRRRESMGLQAWWGVLRVWHEGLDSRVRGNDGLGEGRASCLSLLREGLRMGQRIGAGLVERRDTPSVTPAKAGVHPAAGSVW